MCGELKKESHCQWWFDPRIHHGNLWIKISLHHFNPAEWDIWMSVSMDNYLHLVDNLQLNSVIQILDTSRGKDWYLWYLSKCYLTTFNTLPTRQLFWTCHSGFMNHLTSLVTPVQLISNQHGSNSTQLGMQSWSKWSVQNGVKRWLKCLWIWHGGWCPMRLSEYFYFRKYWSTGIFPSKQSLGCTNMQWDEILWGKCLVCARSQRRMDILLWAKRKATVT